MNKKYVFWCDGINSVCNDGDVVKLTSRTLITNRQKKIDSIGHWIIKIDIWSTCAKQSSMRKYLMSYSKIIKSASFKTFFVSDYIWLLRICKTHFQINGYKTIQIVKLRIL